MAILDITSLTIGWFLGLAAGAALISLIVRMTRCENCCQKQTSIESGEKNA